MVYNFIFVENIKIVQNCPEIAILKLILVNVRVTIRVFQKNTFSKKK